MSTISSSGESESLQGHDDDWYEYMTPEYGKFAVSPVIMIAHSMDEDRDGETELFKELDIDEVTGHDIGVYKVLSDTDHPESDLTQTSWKLEYGIECAENGLTRAFLNTYRDDIDDAEAYAESIADDIFPALKEKTRNYYSD